MIAVQFEYNMNGLLLTISYLEGYVFPEGDVELKFVCGSDGSWSPDPFNYQCVPQVQNQGLYIHCKVVPVLRLCCIGRCCCC